MLISLRTALKAHWLLLSVYCVMWSACGTCWISSRRETMQLLCAHCMMRVYPTHTLAHSRRALCAISYVTQLLSKSSKFYYNYYFSRAFAWCLTKCDNGGWEGRSEGWPSGRSVAMFVMKNELATRSSPCLHTARMNHQIPRISYTSTTTTTTTTETVKGMRLMWFNKRNKVKTEREKPKRKTFCAQGEIEIGGRTSTSTIHLKIERTMKTNESEEEGKIKGNKRMLVIAQFSCCFCLPFGRLLATLLS